MINVPPSLDSEESQPVADSRSQAGTESSSIWHKLAESPDVQKAISEIPSLVRTHIETKNSLVKTQVEAQMNVTRGTIKWILSWTAFLAFVIVAPVSILTWYDKLSSDAATFVLGAIVGAAFTFLRSFFPGHNT